MLSQLQIEEIKEHLLKAQNPVFFYDNDVDGLCSFILLRRYIGRGKGVAVKSYPDLNVQYAKRAQELKADYVFVLDKPLISKEFVEEIDKMQIPLVWIDHHDIEGSESAIEKEIESENSLYLYNPAKNKGKDKSFEPTTYLAYSISGRKEDIWLAVMGCIADHYMPEFIDEFIGLYPEFWIKNNKISDPFEAFYKTEIGRVAQALSFGLKDSITHVVQMQSFLINCRSPVDIFSEVENNSNFRRRYSEIRAKYDAIMSKVDESHIFGNLIFFDYSVDLSISAEIANELCYKYPEKYIAVAYIKGGISNISLRGKKIKKILEKIISKFDGATGGGHEDAAGARLKADDLARFREAIEKEIN